MATKKRRYDEGGKAKSKPKGYAKGGAVKKAKTSDPFAREGIESRTSWDDRNAGRFDKPGTAQQVPAEDYVIRMPGGSDGNWRVVARGSMNYGGVSGGMPSKSAKSLKSRAKIYEEDGASASASAARTRARNVEGHEAMTRKSMKEIKRSQLKAKADAPGASFYDKARSAFAEKTGYAKGGKVSSRGDGVARKGKTKGRYI